MGRKLKLLNEKVKDTILEYIANGNYIKTACMAAGIRESTYYNWLHRAENPVGDDEDVVYKELLEGLKKAEAQNIANTMERIEDAGKKPQYWMAGAWKLERKYPGEFGKRMELEIGPSKVLIAIQEQALKALETPKEIGTQALIAAVDDDA